MRRDAFALASVRAPAAAPASRPSRSRSAPAGPCAKARTPRRFPQASGRWCRRRNRRRIRRDRNSRSGCRRGHAARPTIERRGLGALHVGLEAAEPEQAGLACRSALANAHGDGAGRPGVPSSEISGGTIAHARFGPIERCRVIRSAAVSPQARARERKGAERSIDLPRAPAPHARRRDGPADRAGAARRPARPRHRRYRARAAASRAPAPSSPAKAAAGRRAARLRRRMAADAQRHIQSVESAATHSALAKLIASRTRRHRARAKRRRGLERTRGHRPHAGVPDHRCPTGCRRIPGPRTSFDASLARGDRVISHSIYVARPMIARHRRPSASASSRAHRHRDFNPAAVPAERVAALRHTWGIPPDMRIVLVPGRVAPWNGQLS